MYSPLSLHWQFFNPFLQRRDLNLVTEWDLLLYFSLYPLSAAVSLVSIRHWIEWLYMIKDSRCISAGLINMSSLFTNVLFSRFFSFTILSCRMIVLGPARWATALWKDEIWLPLTALQWMYRSTLGWRVRSSRCWKQVSLADEKLALVLMEDCPWDEI